MLPAACIVFCALCFVLLAASSTCNCLLYILMCAYPRISLHYVLKNIAEVSDSPPNKYILAFSKMAFIPHLLALVDENEVMRRLMNHKSLKKEITELMGALCTIEHVLKKETLALPDICSTCNNDDNVEFGTILSLEKDIVFYDICSGKGVASSFLTLMFPQAHIKMVDFDNFLNLEHLQLPCMQNVSYNHLDIYTDAFESFVKSELDYCRLHGRTPIFLGLHLCGTLSTRLGSLYNKLEHMPMLVISPCCMPRRKRKDKSKHRDFIKKNGWNGYDFWCLSVFVGLDSFTSYRNIRQDMFVASEKNKYIYACRRKAFTPQ